MFHRHTCIRWAHQRCQEPIHWQLPTMSLWTTTIDAIVYFLFCMSASIRLQAPSNYSTELPPIPSASIFSLSLSLLLCSDLFYQRMSPKGKASSQSLSCSFTSMSFCVALICSSFSLTGVKSQCTMWTRLWDSRCVQRDHFSWTSSFLFSLHLFSLASHALLPDQIRSSIFRENARDRLWWSVR